MQPYNNYYNQGNPRPSVKQYTTEMLVAETNQLNAYIQQLDQQSGLIYTQFQNNMIAITKQQLNLKLKYIMNEKKRTQKRILALQREYQRRCMRNPYGRQRY